MAARMKALIAYDGSACADSALNDLKRAGLSGEVEMTVVTVAELWLPPPSATFKSVLTSETEQLPAPIEAALNLAMAASRRLQTIFPAWDVRAETLVGSPASAILNKADEWKPDLIVVGSHGRSALGRFILGSVSQKIVTEAHCSVRVARGRGIDAGAPARILLGFDGSIDAGAAVSTIASREWPEKSAVRVLAVLAPTISDSPLLPWTPEQIAQREASARDWMRKQVEAAAEELRSTGLAVTPVITAGDPKQVLLDEVSDWGADCLFIGARGHNRLVRFMLGSVATAVVARAHCSVEVVRLEKMCDGKQ
jgi:nucleotide-binding universal stress UspA family protein